jgi:hypothetical protein
MLATRRWALVWTALRIAMAIAIVAAVVTQLVATTNTTLELGKSLPLTIWNFFSFFTILSNVGAAVALAWAGVWMLRRQGSTSAGPVIEPRGLAVTLASVTTYMLITGAVYNTLLRSIPLPIGAEPVPWSNEVLHLIGPLFLLADLFVGPARRSLPWRSAWIVVIFPLAWTAYTLIRGPLVPDPGGSPSYWYPYPFLNPNNFDTGYLGTVPYILAIAAGIIGVAFVVVWVGRRRARVSAGAVATV